MKIKEFKLERYFTRFEFSAPYLLSSSDCESLSIKELLNLSGDKETVDKFNNSWLGYTESEGDPELRREISSLYEKILPKDVLCFAGAEEGIFIFMNVLLDKNDHIIVQYPAYQSLYEVANAIGCEVTNWEISEKGDDEWKLDLEFLRKSIQENTKAIVINLPHNPTGMMITQEEFNEIVSIAQENDIYIFCDEVYRFLEYNTEERLTSACDAYPKALSLGVMSKAFGLAGLRIGWIATKDDDIRRKMNHYKDYTTICSSGPSEALATIALKIKEKVLNRNRNIIKRNLELLDKFFDKYSEYFEWRRPKAGSVGFVKAKFTNKAEDFCLKVVKEKGVVLLPGTIYEYGDDYFRVGFGRANMPESLEKFEEYVIANLVKN